MAKISVITITIPERINYLKQAEKYLARQTCQDFEFIVNKSNDVIPKKRNDAVRQAKCDNIIMWDDDDWFANDRIEKQLAAISIPGKKIAFTSHYYVWCLYNQRVREYADTTNWFGGPISFKKEIWLEHPYPENMLRRSDGNFLWYQMHNHRENVIDLRDPTFFVYIFHGSNVSGNEIIGGNRRKRNIRAATHRVRELLGSDIDDIRELQLIKGVQGKADGY